MTNKEGKSTKKSGLLQYLGRAPGVLKVATMIYCAVDPQTPWTVRAFGLFAMFYLVFPIDFIPDVLFLIFGLGVLDDVAVLYMAYKMTESSIKPQHIAKAHEFFQLEENDIS